jgi:hypothetical protein
MYEWGSCHQHWHFRNYAVYDLLQSGSKVRSSAKRGFCMIGKGALFFFSFLSSHF